MTLRISTEPVTGESELLVRDDQFNTLLNTIIAPVPGARGTTQVRWRARLASHRPGLMAKAMGLGTPFAVLSAIDAEALRVLKPSASIHAAALRAGIVTDAVPAQTA